VLLVWAFCGALVIAIRPVHFSLQFLVGFGLPLLALGALGLSRFPPAATLVAAGLMASTAAVALDLVRTPNPYWFVPAVRLQAALALRESCRSGDLLLAPRDIGLYAAGLTACKAYVSHPIAPDFEAREADVRAFIDQARPEERAAFLDRRCITDVALPGPDTDAPERAFGAGTAFRKVGLVGTEPGAIGLFARPGERPVCAGAEPAVP
jgi:hypothetical protein